MTTSKKNRSFDKNLSLTKLIVYLKSSETKRHYSFLRSDKLKGKFASSIILEKLLFKIYFGQYNTAILYDNQNDTILAKWVEGEKVLDKRKYFNS